MCMEPEKWELTGVADGGVGVFHDPPQLNVSPWYGSRVQVRDTLKQFSF